MNKITISFENDDREFEVDEDTIKKIPFLQTYYNFNNNKTNMIKLDYSNYDEVKFVLDTVTNNNINLLDLIEKELNNRCETLDYFGVLSKPLGDGYIKVLSNSLRSLLSTDYYKEFTNVQNFINDKEQQIITLDTKLFDNFTQITSTYNNIIPFYRSDGSIFLGKIPIPIKNHRENLISLDDIIKNKYANISNNDGKINKLFFTIFCLTFESSELFLLFLSDIYDCSFKNFVDLLDCFCDSGYEYCDDNCDALEFKFQEPGRVFLENYKQLCEQCGSNLTKQNKSKKVNKKQEKIKIKFDLSDYLEIEIDRIFIFIDKILALYNNLASNFNVEDLYMTEEDLNLIENRDKYIKIINKCNSNKQLEYGFIKKIE